MSLFGSLKTCLVTKCFSISGRASGSEFWWFMLFFVSVYTAFETYERDILRMIPYNMRTVCKFAALAVIIYLLICATTAMIRRLHDTDRSGWFVLLPFAFDFAFSDLIGESIFPFVDEIFITISAIGSFAMSVWLLVMCMYRGTPGENSYGAPPAGSAAERRYKELSSGVVKAERQERYY